MRIEVKGRNLPVTDEMRTRTIVEAAVSTDGGVSFEGPFNLTANGAKREPVSADEFKTKITAFHDANPELQVLVAGDERVGYGKVYSILPILQEAGVSKIGLMSQPQSAQNGKP